MKISYKDKKLRALCQNNNKLVKAYGQLRATKIMQRIDDMSAAECLEDTRNLLGIITNLLEIERGSGLVIWISRTGLYLNRLINLSLLTVVENIFGRKSGL